MNPLLLAEFEFKHLIYLVFFVIWIVGQYFESQAKKKKKRELEEAQRTARPEPEHERHAPPQRHEQQPSPVEADLKTLLEQLTGQPAPPPVARPVPPPVRHQPPPPLPQDATMEQVRAQSQQLKNRLKQQRAARSPQPPPTPQAAYELRTLETAAAPTPVAPADLSIAMKSFNVSLPKSRLPKMRSAPSSPMRATAEGQRLAWLKSPKSLRQAMVARLVLDPPKALEEAR